MSGKSGRGGGGSESQGNRVSLLLLGPAQSGKSTFFRQLQLMHGKCFTTLQEKITFRPIINENLLGSLHTLVTKMPMFQIALSHKGSEKVLSTFISSGTDEVRAKRDPSLCNESVNGQFWSNLCLNCIFKWT